MRGKNSLEEKVDDNFQNLNDVTKHVLGDVNKLVGKKLVWAAFDENSGEYQLMFDDMSIVSVDGISVADGKSYAQSYLENNLNKAKNTLVLQEILEKNTTQLPLDLSKPATQVIGEIDVNRTDEVGTAQNSEA
jgi:hypothetical protein